MSRKIPLCLLCPQTVLSTPSLIFINFHLASHVGQSSGLVGLSVAGVSFKYTSSQVNSFKQIAAEELKNAGYNVVGEELSVTSDIEAE